MGQVGIFEPSLFVATDHLYLNNGFKNKLKKNQPIQIKSNFGQSRSKGQLVFYNAVNYDGCCFCIDIGLAYCTAEVRARTC